ncbi:hypothetical protein A4G99_06025 [Haladaptatus sp. R4]|uniref:hypothetical protein n=1 Tax=Haladaptatus sp. R4 TaxID=1679489 RepID=UPI0007B4C14C|nr:hypothetical protein [Haladaptatus sp. R4]KZN24027.1 hypothetical protein A4G99_06025 [Haladaptatus sp. R4]
MHIAGLGVLIIIVGISRFYFSGLTTLRIGDDGEVGNSTKRYTKAWGVGLVVLGLAVIGLAFSGS